MSFKRTDDPFEIREHRVGDREEQYLDDIRIEDDFQEEDAIEQMRMRERYRPAKKKIKNKYGWAFFLFSLFIGLGITATTNHPLPLFAGLGTGFLFFVDPIYERIMRAIEQS
ncbi:MAG: UbiA family prenyltransferase [Bacteroidota bacterium]